MLPGGSRLAVPALPPVGAVPAVADLGEQEVGGVSREVGIPVGVSIKLITSALQIHEILKDKRCAPVPAVDLGGREALDLPARGGGQLGPLTLAPVALTAESGRHQRLLPGPGQARRLRDLLGLDRIPAKF